VSETERGPSPEPEAAGQETSAAPPAKRRSRVWPQVLLGIAILVCGMLIGAGGTIVLGRRILVPGARQPAQLSGAIAKGMARRLNLTPEQERETRRIVREHMERVNELRDQGRRDIQQELDAMRDEVAEVLTPQQAQAWKRQFEHIRRFAPQPSGGRRGPGAPPDRGPKPGPP